MLQMGQPGTDSKRQQRALDQRRCKINRHRRHLGIISWGWGQGKEVKGWDAGGRARKGAGVVLIFVARLRCLTIDHTALSRRSLLQRGTPPTLGCLWRFPHASHKNILQILSPSCIALCGHHLSSRTPIVFTLVSNTSISCHLRGTVGGEGEGQNDDKKNELMAGLC